MRAILTQGVTGSPIASRELVFEVDGVRQSAVTDAAGIATTTFSYSAHRTGPITLRALFNGDGQFLASEHSAQAIRYWPSSYAIWGGNTPGPQVGQKFNFWGHSWHTQVTGGAYQAQADFKGWAWGLKQFAVCQPKARPGGDPRLTPECWNSKSGQSSPPSSIPDHLGVIVTDAVAKEKGTVFGNVTGLAVLRVEKEPACGSTPGKPCYGTLLGFIDSGERPSAPVTLRVSQSQPAVALPGETFQVAIELTNPSSTPAESVVVTERFEGSMPRTAEQSVGTVAAGATRTVHFSQTAPPVPGRGNDESAQAYQTRLAGVDGQALSSFGTVRFVDPSGAAPDPIDVTSQSRLALPRLTATLSAPPRASPCGSVPYVVALNNIGSAVASTARAVLELPDGTEQVLTWNEILPGASAPQTVEWRLPALTPKGPNEADAAYLERLEAAAAAVHSASLEIEWTDARGNTYGRLDQSVQTTTALPILAVAAERPVAVLPGQGHPLTLNIQNLGQVRAEDAEIQIAGAPPVPRFALDAGASTPISVQVVVPPVAPKGQTETDAAYHARLSLIDGSAVRFDYSLDWASSCGERYGPLPGQTMTALAVPVATVALEGPGDAVPGQTVQYRFQLSNVGHADVLGMQLLAALPDGTVREIALPLTRLMPGGSLQSSFTYEVPARQPAGELTMRVSLRWSDAASNAYGPRTASDVARVPTANLPPTVNAGADQTVALAASAVLNGAVTDDGLPSGAALSAAWIQVSGPGTAAFSDATKAATQVTFDVAGLYVLRIIGSDGELTGRDEVSVTVTLGGGNGTTVPGNEPVPEESLINVTREGNQLRLANTTQAFNFIWVAVSSKGTVVKLHTETGQILGEYHTSPTGQPKDPSRTTVDKNGNVWASNRAGNSVVHIGLVENGQCIDRNGNGVIDTSRAQDDVLAWTNELEADTEGGVSTAQDECILHYVRVRSSGTRHVSVNADNDVWVSGTGGAFFDLVDGRTGAIKRQEGPVGVGGYGGLIDGNGVIWSAMPLLRWDTALPLEGENGVNWRSYPYQSYGLCIGPDGHVWNTTYGEGLIRRFAPDGELVGTFPQGNPHAQGCVVDRRGHVWIANSLSYNSVGHLLPDGTHLGNVLVGLGPTGVAVDGAGKVWATNYSDGTISRIDPARGERPDGIHPVGEVDFTSAHLGGNPYNYSDMTGSTLSGAPENGTWKFVHDGGVSGIDWGKIGWTGRACGDGALAVHVASSTDGAQFGAATTVRNGAEFDVPNGRYLQVTVTFKRSSKGESPVLYDLSLGTSSFQLPASSNRAPVVNAGSDGRTTMGNPFRLTGSACDDGLPASGALSLAWTMVSGPGTATLSQPQQEATDVTFSAPGVYLFRLSANDGALQSEDEVSVTVLPRNQPPRVSAVGPASVDLPATAQLIGTATDDGLPGPLTFQWRSLSGPGTVTVVAPTLASTVAAFSAPGTYVLRFSASDGQLSSETDLTVRVNPAPPVNQAPIVSAGAPQSISMESAANLQGSVTDDGLPEGSGLFMTWMQMAGPGSTSFEDPSSPVTTAHFSLPGLYVLRLSASDFELSAFAEVAISVEESPTPSEPPSNERPRVSAGPNGAVTLPQSYRLVGTASDDGLPAGSTLSLEWSQVTGPGSATFTAPQQLETQVSFPVAGGYVFRLVASDGQLTSSSDVSVMVSPEMAPNLAPRVSAGPNVSFRLPQRTATLVGTVEDDGFPLFSTVSLSWAQVGGPAALSFGSPTQAATAITVSQPGIYRLRLAASDGDLSSSAEMTVEVGESVEANGAPVVNAGPDLTVYMPATDVPLNGTASDDGRPVGGTLLTLWEQVAGPAPVAFTDAARPDTTASFTAAGSYLLRLSAFDGEWTASTVVQVSVLPNVVNQPPSVSATGPGSVTLPDAASLSGSVRDDGLPASGTLTVSWTRVSGPGPVSFAAPNQVSTTASVSAPGDYVLRLTASDGSHSASSDVALRVLVVNQPPVVSAGANQSLPHPTRQALLAGQASDDGLPAGEPLRLLWTLVQGPGEVLFESPEQAATRVDFSYPGTYVLRLTASDSEKVSSADVTLSIAAASGAAPTASISAPADGAAVSGPVSIVGSTSGGEWKLEYRLGADSEAEEAWTLLANGNGSATNAPLATFDPTLLLNGTYEIRLVATTSEGAGVASIALTASGNQKVGNFTLSFEDLNVPVGGLPIRIIRTYDTRDKRTGEFGVGWTLQIANARVEKSGVLGRAWEQTRSGGIIPTYCVRPTRAAEVTITFSNDKQYRFVPELDTPCSVLYPVRFANVRYRAISSQGGELLSFDGGQVYVEGEFPGPVQLVSFDTFETFNPRRFQLTSETGVAYAIDQRRGVEAITDRAGNWLQIGPDGVLHSSGKSISFDRDEQGRIQRMVDPNGNALSYHYDLRGDLVRMVDREGQPSTYSYDHNHGLLSMRDASGRVPLRNEYDENGRLLSHTDATGRKVEYQRDLALNHEIVTDRLGHSTLYEYDENGNIVRVTNARGGVHAYTFDERGNKRSETDPLGRTTQYEYDARDNRISETDALGRITRYTYNEWGQRLSVVDPAGGRTDYTYDPSGNLLTETDPLGQVTRYTYDSRGLALTQTDASGNETRNTYDADGNLVEVVEPLGRVTRSTYDENGNKLTETIDRTVDGQRQALTTRFEYDRQGRLVKTTLPDGSTQQSVWSPTGQLIATIDTLGRRTDYRHDAQDKLLETLFPDGTSERSTWDAEGRRLSHIDQMGRTTGFAYDELGRLARINHADGTFTMNSYDAAGNLAAQTNELGQSTTFQYDAVGQRVREIDSLGASTAFAYDVRGNVVSVTEPSGAITRTFYDALGQQIRVEYPDGTTEQWLWDASGRNTVKTDAGGQHTTYGYDALGRLVQVTDMLGGVTRYQYDELGNQVSMVDANGRTTLMAYDSLGRRTRRTLPMGQTESWTYDAAGNLLLRTDFAGRTTTFTYDAMNRLLRKRPAASLGQPDIEYHYSPTGKRLQMVDGTGTTSYRYDARDRLVQKTSPFGTLAYTYDGTGNLTSIRSSNPGGTTVNYTYDVGGNLSRAEDTSSSMPGTVYRYDANNNIQGYTLPNGVAASYAYDSRNRLTGVGVEGPTGTLVRYAYTLGPAGNRLSVSELSGRTVQYQYDALYRLTREEVSGGAAAGTVSYTYDAVGNRRSRASTLPGVPDINSSYNANDQLQGPQYDMNGNTTADGGQTYAYDFENRLTSLNGSAVTFSYDGDGLRVSRVEGGQAIHYLWDSQNPTGRPQVLEEVSGGAAQVVYTYGHALLSQRRRSGQAFSDSFYVYDGHGSVRLLTGADGSITDAYDYDAFGTLIHSSGNTPNTHRYSGEAADSSLGMVYLRARYLHPSSGRFWTRDARDGDIFEPKSLHRYTYADGDPVNRNDPTGEVSNLIWGRKVHRDIGQHFVGQDPANRRADVSISRILGYRVPYAGRMRPDLVDTSELEVYEIKPLGSYPEGLMQLTGYILSLSYFDPLKRPWTYGKIYSPPGFIALEPMVFALVSPPVQGVIIYEAFDFRLYIAALTAATVSSMNLFEARVAFAVAVIRF